MDLLITAFDILPWYLRPTGSEHLREWLIDWGSERAVVRNEDVTLLFLWLYKWLALGALVWGLGVALAVSKRSTRGRFRGDPEKRRDALIAGSLHAVVGALVAGVFLFALFLIAALGPGPWLWLAALGVTVHLLRRAHVRRRRAAAGPTTGAKKARTKKTLNSASA
jgi:hypothetical protein